MTTGGAAWSATDLRRRGGDPGDLAPVAHGGGGCAGALAPAAVGLDPLELEGEGAQRQRLEVAGARRLDEALDGVDDVGCHARFFHASGAPPAAVHAGRRASPRWPLLQSLDGERARVRSISPRPRGTQDARRKRQHHHRLPLPAQDRGRQGAAAQGPQAARGHRPDRLHRLRGLHRLLPGRLHRDRAGSRSIPTS